MKRSVDQVTNNQFETKLEQVSRKSKKFEKLEPSDNQSCTENKEFSFMQGNQCKNGLIVLND